MFDKVLYTGKCRADIVNGCCIGGADKAFAAGSECRSRNNCNVLADEQLLGEIFGGKTG